MSELFRQQERVLWNRIAQGPSRTLRGASEQCLKSRQRHEKLRKGAVNPVKSLARVNLCAEHRQSPDRADDGSNDWNGRFPLRYRVTTTRAPTLARP